MTNVELSRCAYMYPRLFSMSVAGKLTEVLRALAEHAARHLQHRREQGLPLSLPLKQTSAAKDEVQSIEIGSSTPSMEVSEPIAIQVKAIATATAPVHYDRPLFGCPEIGFDSDEGLNKDFRTQIKVLNSIDFSLPFGSSPLSLPLPPVRPVSHTSTSTSSPFNSKPTIRFFRFRRVSFKNK